MRLWHQALISKLPRQQLLGQHRECCALRGKGWGRKHSTVDYVFTHLPERLVAYHYLVMDEMEKRGYKPNEIWRNINYRGSSLGICPEWCDEHLFELYHYYTNGNIYLEHNDEYYQECLNNLSNKNIHI